MHIPSPPPHHLLCLAPLPRLPELLKLKQRLSDEGRYSVVFMTGTRPPPCAPLAIVLRRR